MEGINLIQFAGVIQDIRQVDDNKVVIRLAVYTSRYKDRWEQIKCYPSVSTYGRIAKNSAYLKHGDLIHVFAHWQEEKEDTDDFTEIRTEFVADKVVKLN